eukprot:jgi/Botrbrau1/14758/Bobra.0103s0008.1
MAGHGREPRHADGSCELLQPTFEDVLSEGEKAAEEANGQLQSANLDMDDREKWLKEQEDVPCQTDNNESLTAWAAYVVGSDIEAMVAKFGLSLPQQTIL